MKNDIDSISAELTQELAFSSLEKALPPKLKYRYYKWLRQFSGKLHDPKVSSTINKAVEYIESIKNLKKNEMMASFYDNGTVRMDFGGEVSSKVKEAAMKWAKKRGLKASEASLDKSESSASYVVYSESLGSGKASGLPATSIKYSI